MKVPARWTDIDPTMAVTIALNQYKESQAKTRDLQEKAKALIAEQEQRDRDARREARRNGR